MDKLKILNDNFEAKDNSFLYYLHEKNYFHEKAFSELCGSITGLYSHSQNKVISGQICFIYGQVLKHIIYHFDPNDLSRISNLPCDYNERLTILENAVTEYFSS